MYGYRHNIKAGFCADTINQTDNRKAVRIEPPPDKFQNTRLRDNAGAWLKDEPDRRKETQIPKLHKCIL